MAGDDVTHGKPHPEAYFTAAASLGIRPRDCLAIEDTDTGAASAVVAGMTVLVIPHLAPVPDGPSRSTRETVTGPRRSSPPPARAAPLAAPDAAATASPIPAPTTPGPCPAPLP
ncbi:hypothetical protein C9424_08145 [Arthrobacter sp. H-02-3]|nr:hypothetical protein C9424_08145 [Arthrobacter sp. H-02-3]